MLDRYDPRDEDGRSRGESFERHRGSRGSSDRDDDGRSTFGRHVDLPRGQTASSCAIGSDRMS